MTRPGEGCPWKCYIQPTQVAEKGQLLTCEGCLGTIEITSVQRVGTAFYHHYRHVPVGRGGGTRRGSWRTSAIQLDLEEGRRRRDEGMEAAQRGDSTFSELVRAYVTSCLVGREVTGEDIRVKCTELGITGASPNAWGGVINGLVRSGVLVFTGRYTQMKAVSSNARETKIYRVVSAPLAGKGENDG